MERNDHCLNCLGVSVLVVVVVVVVVFVTTVSKDQGIGGAQFFPQI